MIPIQKTLSDIKKVRSLSRPGTATTTIDFVIRPPVSTTWKPSMRTVQPDHFDSITSADTLVEHSSRSLHFPFGADSVNEATPINDLEKPTRLEKEVEKLRSTNFIHTLWGTCQQRCRRYYFRSRYFLGRHPKWVWYLSLMMVLYLLVLVVLSFTALVHYFAKEFGSRQALLATLPSAVLTLILCGIVRIAWNVFYMTPQRRANRWSQEVMMWELLQRSEQAPVIPFIGYEKVDVLLSFFWWSISKYSSDREKRKLESIINRSCDMAWKRREIEKRADEFIRSRSQRRPRGSRRLFDAEMSHVAPSYEMPTAGMIELAA